jgi:hypothetical protein
MSKHIKNLLAALLTSFIGGCAHNGETQTFTLDHPASTEAPEGLFPKKSLANEESEGQGVTGNPSKRSNHPSIHHHHHE